MALTVQLELQIHDTQCAVGHVLDWSRRIKASCSTVQALRVTQFVTSLQSRMPTLHGSVASIHVHTINTHQEVTKSILGKRRNSLAISGDDDDTKSLYKAAAERLYGSELESLLNNISSV